MAASQKKFPSLHLLQFVLFEFGDNRNILSGSCSVPISKKPHSLPVYSAASLALILAPEDFYVW